MQIIGKENYSELNLVVFFSYGSSYGSENKPDLFWHKHTFDIKKTWQYYDKQEMV